MLTGTSSAEIIPLNPATPPSARESSRIPFEKFKELWQRQIIADSRLPASALRIAIAISCHMSRTNGGEAWPGMAKLATLSAMSRRSVIRAVERLETAGHIEVRRSMEGKRHSLNHYVPILKSSSATPADTDAEVSGLSPPSDRPVTSPSDKAMSHKPLNITSEVTSTLRPQLTLRHPINKPDEGS
jgi:DNA-binding MarR family transcriptional regulator